MTVPVLLLHGLGGSPAAWQRITPLLQGAGPVEIPTLRNPQRIEAEADALAARPRVRRCVVVGHSRGGLVATSLAERHPGDVAHLVMVNVPPTTASRLTARSGGERLLAVPAVGPLVWAAMPPAVAARGLATAFAPGTEVPPEFVRSLRATEHRAFLDATRAIDRYLAAGPLRNRLAELGHPVDVVMGALDRRVDVEAYDGWDRQGIPITRIPDAGHTPIWERPAAVAAVINHAIRTAAAADHR